MAENIQPYLYHSLPRRGLWGPCAWFSGHLTAVAGVVAAVAAALFICAPWSLAIAAGLAIITLSAVENESFLLLVILLIPVGWVLSADVPLRNVPVAVRALVIVGFFLGRLWHRRMGMRSLLRPYISRTSLLFLAAVLATTVLVGEARTHETARSLFEMVSYLGFYFLVLAWADSPQRIQKVLTVLLCSTIVTAGFAILQEIVGGYTSLWLSMNPPDDSFLPWESRATSFLNYSNSLAGYLNLVLPLGLACYVLGKGKSKHLGAWTVGLGFVALISTQSMGGLAAFACVLVLAIFCFSRNWQKKLLLLGGVCALALVFYLAKETLNPAHVGDSVVDNDAMTRLLLWSAAWDLFTHSPVAGVGWGNFVTLYGYDLRFSGIPPGVFAVHNIYLQLLAETGITGFVAFFSLIFIGVREARRQFRSTRNDLSRGLAFGVLGATLTVLVHGLVDFLFQVSPQFGTVFWVLLALLVANASVQASEGLAGARRHYINGTPEAVSI